VRSAYPDLAERRAIHEIVRRMINELVTDLIQESSQRLEKMNLRSVEDVRQAEQVIIGFSQRVAEEHQQLKQFLRQQVYHHSRVLAMTAKAQRVVTQLFDTFLKTPGLLPADAFRSGEEHLDASQRQARAVADYIAGMTDRFALKEHNRLFDPNLTSF